MLSLAEARAALLDGVGRVGLETVAIAHCAGRILAADVLAARDQPHAALSAMDGYAMRRADLVPGAELLVIGEAPAGARFDASVGPGQSVRIATGGCVPDGADLICIQEHVVRDGDMIRIVDANAASNYIRGAAADFAEGQCVALAGEPITPGRHALIAATNAGSVRVARRPRVAIFPSGDELREPGSVLGNAQTVNSGSFAIADLVEACGGEAAVQPILPDALDTCLAQLKASDLAADLIVTLGGASVGDRDVLRPSFEALGARMVFDRIAVIPGKPTWHARFPDGRLLLGLPGNPASAFVCAHLLLRPLISALTGQTAREECVPATCARPLPANGPREAFLRASVAIDRRGYLRVAADARQDSSLLTPLASANALLRRAPNAPASEAGALVEILLIGDIHAEAG